MIEQSLTRSCGKLVEVIDQTAEKIYPSDIAKVVKRHARLTILTACIPIPGLDAVMSAIAIWTMYFRINDKIGIKSRHHLFRIILSAMGTNILGFIAATIVADVLKIIPGIGSVAGAVIMGVAFYAITVASGRVYIEALTMKLRQKGR